MGWGANTEPLELGRVWFVWERKPISCIMEAVAEKTCTNRAHMRGFAIFDVRAVCHVIWDRT